MGEIEELNKTKPCSQALVHPVWEDLLALLGQYGIGGMESVGLMDTSHDEKDIRWNYLVDKRYALRLTNAPEMTEARLEDLNRLIARYGDFGLRCPAFLRGKDGRFFHSWGELTVYLSEYVDLPVAEEAALTAQFLGHEVVRCYDAGVAGLHRLLAHLEEIMEARVIIAIAGMEGALPSVVGGLASCPVLAVPTSVGYGASFGGVSALLSMLNSCASGVSVVNIDNGFGAAFQASLINHLS